uniref:Beta-lactamase-related domain-containing protein n=1 Tax=Chromera velia CCMP2878 TaxID=1169474 RepID=A0A0G4HNM0_9ALVE|eukprot:Cvel_29462.t1-p1 / transcript=Cvel_29462.t1 / gene=Cvel_29462 / organism=Chromera_velia_CCMP2878 / gene_product=Protein flp, putative / transcript_product=Protein flp, putative / location=Cvel_scaffold4032:5935-7149(+) / protein_length=405 / sequence_SO=supercontig / SO=protein_coding / is_pseudo=false
MLGRLSFFGLLFIRITEASEPLRPLIRKEVDFLNRRALSFHAVSGCSAALRRGGKEVYSFAEGFADVGIPQNSSLPVEMTGETQMRVASCTKTMTGAVIVHAAFVKKLFSLDDTVESIVSRDPKMEHEFMRWDVWRRHSNMITIRHLLSHTSGIRHYQTNAEYWGILADKTGELTDVFRFFGNDPLEFVPGKEYLYSAFGYSTLGILLEIASGVSYFQYLRTYLFDPGELPRTFAGRDDVSPVEAPSAVPYMRRCTDSGSDRGGYKEVARCSLTPAEQPDLNMKGASGAVVSTASDLAKVAEFIVLGDFLPADVRELELLKGNAEVPPPQGGWYSAGWHQSDETDPRRVWHAGGAVGGLAWVQVDRNKGLTASVMCNTQASADVANSITKNMMRLEDHETALLLA